MLTHLDQWETRFSNYLSAHLAGNDGSHDLHHFKRVWRTAQQLLREENAGGDELVILTAAYFHDLISLPKNHPEASTSSWLSAQETGIILRTEFTDFPAEKIEPVQHAIHAHSFSANITPLTLEAKLLQDADRMEAIGAIGIARVFYTAGLLGKEMFAPTDPLATGRPLNDKQYALDHFRQKLLKLPGLMNTGAGRALAASRATYLRGFMEQLLREVSG